MRRTQRRLLQWWSFSLSHSQLVDSSLLVSTTTHPAWGSHTWTPEALYRQTYLTYFQNTNVVWPVRLKPPCAKEECMCKCACVNTSKYGGWNVWLSALQHWLLVSYHFPCTAKTCTFNLNLTLKTQMKNAVKSCIFRFILKVEKLPHQWI